MKTSDKIILQYLNDDVLATMNDLTQFLKGNITPEQALESINQLSVYLSNAITNVQYHEWKKGEKQTKIEFLAEFYDWDAHLKSSMQKLAQNQPLHQKWLDELYAVAQGQAINPDQQP